jgi:hypothetical protein
MPDEISCTAHSIFRNYESNLQNISKAMKTVLVKPTDECIDTYMKYEERTVAYREFLIKDSAYALKHIIKIRNILWKESEATDNVIKLSKFIKHLTEFQSRIVSLYYCKYALGAEDQEWQKLVKRFNYHIKTDRQNQYHHHY